MLRRPGPLRISAVMVLSRPLLLVDPEHGRDRAGERDRIGLAGQRRRQPGPLRAAAISAAVSASEKTIRAVSLSSTLAASVCRRPGSGRVVVSLRPIASGALSFARQLEGEGDGVARAGGPFEPEIKTVWAVSSARAPCNCEGCRSRRSSREGLAWPCANAGTIAARGASRRRATSLVRKP